MKLISMTDFLPEHPYSKFLKQPLELWMFVPCDDNGDIIPLEYNDEEHPFVQHLGYQQAKERCLFNGFDVEKANILIKCFSNIEALSRLNKKFELTQTAIKQLGL